MTIYSICYTPCQKQRYRTFYTFEILTLCTVSFFSKTIRSWASFTIQDRCQTVSNVLCLCFEIRDTRSLIYKKFELKILKTKKVMAIYLEAGGNFGKPLPPACTVQRVKKVLWIQKPVLQVFAFPNRRSSDVYSDNAKGAKKNLLINFKPIL